MQTQAIVLAAGQGTRMNHPELPKVLIEAAGRPLLTYVLEVVTHKGIPDPVIVIGFRADKVRATLGPRRYALQEAQNGTGSAILSARSELGSFTGAIYLLNGDHPCITVQTLNDLEAALTADVAIAVSTGQVHSIDDRYGRILRKANGDVDRIVEYKDATDAERAITEYNAGFYLVRSPWLWSALERVQPSPVTGEYYLTDIIEFANLDGLRVVPVPVRNQEEADGVNTPAELEHVSKILRGRKAQG
ncbi:NTP transferase domain-containing protein [Candidatus Berkelbacteria bacterium]|nr:NTP transferase domain-containing protein [Candidatus Berkelbacteria bacterium]